MTKARKTDTPHADNIEPLTGSTPPGAGSPTFEPAAERVVDEAGYRCLSRPMMRSSSQRLADLVVEHRRMVEFYDAISSHEDRTQGRFGSGTSQAARMLNECEVLIEAIPARSLHDLGLKARVLSWSRAEWWDERATDEPGARNLVDDVLSLAGLDRIRRAGWSLSEIMPEYQGQPRHLPCGEEAGEGAAPISALCSPATDTELGRLAAEYRATVRRYRRLDQASLDATSEHVASALEAEDASRRAIEDRATYVRAQSAQDALFQVLLMSSSVESLHSWIGSDPKDVAVSRRADLLLLEIRRCLWSVRGVLEQLAGVSGGSLNDGFGMEPCENPHVFDLEALLSRAQGNEDKQVAA